MSPRRHAMSFLVTLHEPVGIDLLAEEVAGALGIGLGPGEERGLPNSYVGELAGLNIWLYITDLQTSDAPQRTVLMGEPISPPGEAAEWVNLGPPIADQLAESTGRAWKSE